VTTLNRWPPQARLIDVGPRDGLQNEKQPVPTAVKIELVHRLHAAGLKETEVTSYVSPKWVPQMADNHEVIRRMEAKIKAAIDRVWGGDQVAGGASTTPAEISLVS
jgi:isopropylmalate/homocitrate/citramalate synthase